MKSIRRGVEKFCASHPNFGIPRLMLFLVIGNALVYLISRMDTSNLFLSAICFDPYYILRGQIWRLVTWLFIPSGSSLIWVVIELWFYYFIGSTLENVWGPGRFTFYYLLGALLNVLLGFILYFALGHVSGFITPYYMNLSMFFAYATLFPDQQFLIFFFIPVKAKWLAIADAVLLAFSAISSILSGGWFFALLPVVAVLNYFLFCWPDLEYALHRSRAGNINNTIRFRQAKREMHRKAEQERATGYRHKCCVCGRTDTDYPELEFRYCSRCQGYHCFCQDHINSHVHFTE